MSLTSVEEQIVAALDSSWREVRDIWRRSKKPVRAEHLMNLLRRLAAEGLIERDNRQLPGVHRRRVGGRNLVSGNLFCIETYRLRQL